HEEGPGPHVLLFEDDLCQAFLPVVGERVVRVLEQTGSAACRGRRHGGWQIDQPLGMDGKARHRLESGGAAAFLDCDGAAESRVEDALARDQRELEHVVMGVLKAKSTGRSTSGFSCRPERTGRLAIDALSWNLDELLFRPAQRAELAAEGASGIEAD